MANVELNPVFEGFSKKVGHLVFYKRNGKTFSRKSPAPRKSDSEKQVQVRKSFLTATAAWRQVKGVIQMSWKSAAQKKGQSGYNTFMEKNIEKVRNGIALILSMSFGMESIENLTVKSGGTGEISCEFTLPGAGGHLYFFTQKKENETVSDILKRYDAGDSPASPFIIGGLESGADYIVYGMTTDAPFSEAKLVSASSSGETKAG